MTQLALSDAVLLAHAFVDRVARDHDVRVMFIKGAAAVEQGLRPPQGSLDVDALVDPDRLQVLRDGLGELGWIDENPYSTPTSASYSRTHRHAAWPCELDLHSTFPGLCAPDQEVFERLWSTHELVEVAACEVPCPDRQAHVLVLALNSLREPEAAEKILQLDDLISRVSRTFDTEALSELGDLARDIGASDTAAPFLAAVSAPNVGVGSTPPAELQAWQLRTQPSWRVATWLEGLRQQPIRSKPRYLWNAVFLDEGELRLADPSLKRDRWSVLRARIQRLRRGIRALPAAVRGVSTIKNPPATSYASVPVVQTTWRSRQVPRSWVALGSAVIGGLDRVVPKRGIVLRTFPDFDDQGLETAAAIIDNSLGDVTWLVKAMPPSPTIQQRLPEGVRLVDAGALRGLWSYLRARVVVHTHGIYGGPPRSSRKIFVNLWHGWGTKRLVDRPLVARRQSDIVTVPSSMHAESVSSTWCIPRARVAVTGLPRNDAMIRASRRRRPDTLSRVIDASKPLVVWLPTYRSSIVGEIRQDGRDFHNDFQLPDVDRASVEQLATAMALEIVVKTHPMARIHSSGDKGGLHVWDNDGLEAVGVTLYEFLGYADILVTDYSSVWVDYLLLDRPIIFTTADLQEYTETRGAVPAAELTKQLPGQTVGDLEGLREALSSALDNDPWAPRRRQLIQLHHDHVDGDSARRVASEIREALKHGRRCALQSRLPG